MKRSRFSEEQVIGILREAQAGSPVKAVCATHNISAATYHAWKRKYGGMEVNEARRLRALEEDWAAFLPLPVKPFEACRQQARGFHPDLVAANRKHGLSFYPAMTLCESVCGFWKIPRRLLCGGVKANV